MFRLMLGFILAAVTFHSAGADFSVIRTYVHPIVHAQSISAITSNQSIITGSGSSISIAPGYLLTAAHVVPDTPKQSIFVFDGFRWHKATPIKIDRKLDIALLSAQIQCPCVTLGTATPAVDETVQSAGFPLYTTYQLLLVSSGTVQGSYQGNTVTTSITAPGGSGGGVFYKEGDDYRLVGLTVAIGSTPLGPQVMNISQQYNWLSFNVPVETIRAFLKGTLGRFPR